MTQSNKKLNKPKKQHYVSQSFLAAWTNTGRDDGKLLVLDKTTGNTWPSLPKSVAYETHLYTKEADSPTSAADPFGVENQLEKVESAAMPILKETARLKRVPIGDPFHVLAIFLATQFVRVPRNLDNFAAMTQRFLTHAHNVAVSSPKMPKEKRAALISEILELATEVGPGMEIKKNHQLVSMLTLALELVPVLLERNWAVLDATEASADFVCTDAPVILVSAAPPSPHYGVGFGSPGTLVFCPLSPSVALLGTWDRAPPTIRIGAQRVAFWNGKLLGQMHRFVFSRGEFAAQYASGVIHDRQEVISTFQALANKAGGTTSENH